MLTILVLDIPLPARELYVKNGIRYIYDIETDNVPIVANTEVDLTQIRMRACAKPHIIYLRNMGVVSSFSIAIIAEGQLWGLFAFHGYRNAYQPPLSLRIACETISAMLSVRIEALMRKHQSTRIMQLGESMMSFRPDKSVIHNLFDFGEKTILKVLDAEILVAQVQDAREDEADGLVLGDRSLVPSPIFWERLKSFPNRELCIISTRQGLDEQGLTEDCCPPCGIVYFREGRTQIMIGRAARSRDVVWAGDPDLPKLKIGGILNPRNSFEQFMEKARKESRAWSAEDISVCSVF